MDASSLPSPLHGMTTAEHKTSPLTGNHLTASHTPAENVYACTFCKKRTSASSRPEVCPHCNKRSGQSINMKKQTTCTSEKSSSEECKWIYVCPYCKSGFLVSQSITQPESCPQCKVSLSETPSSMRNKRVQRQKPDMGPNSGKWSNDIPHLDTYSGNNGVRETPNVFPQQFKQTGVTVAALSALQRNAQFVGQSPNQTSVQSQRHMLGGEKPLLQNEYRPRMVSLLRTKAKVPIANPVGPEGCKSPDAPAISHTAPTLPIVDYDKIKDSSTYVCSLCSIGFISPSRPDVCIYCKAPFYHTASEPPVTPHMNQTSEPSEKNPAPGSPASGKGLTVGPVHAFPTFIVRNNTQPREESSSVSHCEKGLAPKVHIISPTDDRPLGITKQITSLLYGGEKPQRVPHDENQDGDLSQVYCIAPVEEKPAENNTKTHRCPYCRQSFSHPVQLKEHIQTHSGGKRYVCPHCDMSFVTKLVLLRHIACHAVRNPFVCPVCDMRFSTNATLHRHIASHGVKNIHVCCHCNNGFYGPKRTKLCPCCTKKFKSSFSLTKLITEGSKKSSTVLHSVEGGSQPSPTPAISPTHTKTTSAHGSQREKSSPVTHNKTTSGRRRNVSSRFVEEHVCPYCSKMFRELFRLRAHLRTHVGEKSPVSRQPEKQISYPPGLNRDMFTNTEDAYVCPLCGKGYATTLNLTLHTLTHTREKPLTCPQCHEEFKDNRSFNVHIDIVHDENSSTNYSILKSILKSPESQVSPVKSRSTKVPRLEGSFMSCDMCVRGFINVGELVKHLKLHSIIIR